MLLQNYASLSIGLRVVSMITAAGRLHFTIALERNCILKTQVSLEHVR